MPARKRPTRRDAAPPGPDRIVDAALALAAERSWRDISLADIAAEAGGSLADVHAAFRSKPAILAAFVDRIDDAVLAGMDPGAAGEPVRDRLMDTLLRRLDALKPYKESVRALVRDGGGDPLAGLCGAARLLRSMAWTLEAAGVSSAGLPGCVRVKGLAAIYLSTMRVWLADDSEDSSRTMAHLDRRLQQAERLLAWLPRPPRYRQAAA
ncbi:MAG: TetR family transcriptional regulator [Rhodospirillales bacterium]